MASTVGLALAVGLTIVVVTIHFTRGLTWQAGSDITQTVIERRAASVPETDFPEPMNRAIGGGGGAAVTAGGEEAAELEGEAPEDGEDNGPWSLSDDEAELFEIEYAKEGETIEVRENETILEAGEDEGWDLPYACREGQCLSCAGHIPDGESEDFVVHHDQEMLDDDELGDGYTLTCVAYPKSNFTIETNESP